MEVITGIVTDASKLHKTYREHNEFFKLLQEAGIDVKELKGREIFRGKNEWKKINAKLRKDILNYTLDWIENRKCKIIVIPIDTKKFFNLKSDGNKLALKFEYPWETGAFNILLAIQRCHCKIKKIKGKTIVVFDELEGHGKRLINIYNEDDLSYIDNFTNIKDSKNKKGERFSEIIDTPFFSKS
ncbi:MAG TPA: hypothetical protein DEP28_04125 [Bacteroidetes bacterium]|nr:hypothetical protein [Bacteroidota bacterium]